MNQSYKDVIALSEDELAHLWAMQKWIASHKKDISTNIK